MSRCAACGSDGLQQFFDGFDWYVGATGRDERFPYVRCSVCGTVAAEPPPSADVLRRAYARYGPLAPERGLLERLLEPLARREARRVVAAARADGELLDVGCGAGRFLERLRAAGWRGSLRGLEPDADAARHASRAAGVPVRVGGVDALADETPELAALVLRHVIEHVPEPLETLETARGLLARDGVLYLGTPDARALSARVFGRFWHGYDPPRHLFAFTAPAVRRLLERAGFAVEREFWDFAPQMWTGSLHHALARGRERRWASLLTSNVNPVAAAPAVVGAAAEVVTRRSTMYAVLARPA